MKINRIIFVRGRIETDLLNVYIALLTFNCITKGSDRGMNVLIS